MNIHFIQHEVFEAPGAYLHWADRNGFNTTFSKVYEGDTLPADTAGIDVLIVLGGPQSPDTTIVECPYFDASAEVGFIGRCISEGKAVVGVCLGAQLIGEALGARYEHSPETEIGVFPIHLTAEGLADRKTSHFGSSTPVGHWHNDMPGLPPQSKVLATSEGCPRQIVAYTPIVYGLQCHCEFTSQVVDMMIAHDTEAFNRNKRFVQPPDEVRNQNYDDMNTKLFRFMDELIKEYKSTKLPLA